MIAWVRTNRSQGDGLLLVDESSRTAIDKPPQISGYNPDLYWRSVRGDSVLIGEAKSAYDIESRHSRKQLTAFLAHLARAKQGVLLVAVPWHAVPQMKSLVRAIQREGLAQSTEVVFLDFLPG